MVPRSTARYMGDFKWALEWEADTPAAKLCIKRRTHKFARQQDRFFIVEGLMDYMRVS